MDGRLFSRSMGKLCLNRRDEGFRLGRERLRRDNMTFLGRKKEIEQIKEALEGGKNLIVSGKYGMGRTSLIKQVAEGMQNELWVLGKETFMSFIRIFLHNEDFNGQRGILTT